MTVGSTGNSATYQYTGISNTENRAIALAGTAATISMTQPANNLTLSGAISGSTPLTINTPGTVTLTGANLHSGGTTLTGGGTLSIPVSATSNALGTNGLTLGTAGSTLSITGNVASAMTANLYLATGRTNLQNDNFPALQGGVYTLTSTVNYNGLVTGNPNGLAYSNAGTAGFTNTTGDTEIGAVFSNAAVSTNASNFTAIFSSVFRPQTTGTYTFQVSGQDDNAVFWLDKNQNGTFDTAATEKLIDVGCCGTTTTATAALVAGQSYKVAWAVEDTGGGSGLVGSFQAPGGLMTIVNPSDPLQAALRRLRPRRRPTTPPLPSMSLPPAR